MEEANDRTAKSEDTATGRNCVCPLMRAEGDP